MEVMLFEEQNALGDANWGVHERVERFGAGVVGSERFS
jgi:hypothetical protein